jgi:hypothetical protein
VSSRIHLRFLDPAETDFGGFFRISRRIRSHMRNDFSLLIRDLSDMGLTDENTQGYPEKSELKIYYIWKIWTFQNIETVNFFLNFQNTVSTLMSLRNPLGIRSVNVIISQWGSVVPCTVYGTHCKLAESYWYPINQTQSSVIVITWTVPGIL